MNFCFVQGSRRYYEMEVHNQRAAQERQLRRGTSQVGTGTFSTTVYMYVSAQYVLYILCAVCILRIPVSMCSFSGRATKRL